MPCRPGSHVAYERGQEVVVEWYDFGADAPYESANLLIFDRAAQGAFAIALGMDPSAVPDRLAAQIAARFASYFAVKAFAEAQAIPFTPEVDFQP